MSARYDGKATFYKRCNYLIHFIVVAIAACAAIYNQASGNKIVATIIFVVIGVVHTLYATFKPGQLGLNYRLFVYNLNMLYIDGDEARDEIANSGELSQYARSLNKQVERIGYEVFKATSGPTSLSTDHASGTNLISETEVDWDHPDNAYSHRSIDHSPRARRNTLSSESDKHYVVEMITAKNK